MCKWISAHWYHGLSRGCTLHCWPPETSMCGRNDHVRHDSSIYNVNYVIVLTCDCLVKVRPFEAIKCPGTVTVVSSKWDKIYNIMQAMSTLNRKPSMCLGDGGSSDGWYRAYEMHYCSTSPCSLLNKEAHMIWGSPTHHPETGCTK